MDEKHTNLAVDEKHSNNAVEIRNDEHSREGRGEEEKSGETRSLLCGTWKVDSMRLIKKFLYNPEKH